jgi:prepilin signal peptidase PulO-like enzyme (type II secretory pathway)
VGDAESGDDDEREEEDEDDDDGEPPPEYWGHRKVRFGPFLALGALEFLFFGDVVLQWYAGLF